MPVNQTEKHKAILADARGRRLQFDANNDISHINCQPLPIAQAQATLAALTHHIKEYFGKEPPNGTKEIHS